MTIRALIFDIGGVLIRVENPAGRRKWEARLGLPEGKLDSIVFGSEVSLGAMIGKVPEAELWNQVAISLDLEGEARREFERDFWRGEEIDSALVELIGRLRPRYKIGILSNAWSNARDILNRKYQLESLADVLIFSAEEKLAKPDPRIFRLTLDRLGVQPEEALFVDDVAENIEAARRVGLYAIQFKNTAQTISEIESLL